ncbi:MAG TPA: LamG domain-containing protein [Actinomycetes bacterium]|nr:LamG domain-containing protein [Actinomycetes bacterium]
MPTFNKGFFDPNIFDTGPVGEAFQNNAFQHDAFQVGDVVVGFINQTATPFAPTISTVGAQTYSAPLIDRTAVAFAPTVSLSLSVGLINQAAVAFAPLVAKKQTVTVARINQNAVANAPAVVLGEYAVLIVSHTPVAYWRLGEASGTTAGDSWDSHPGFYENTPTLGVTGALANDTNKAVTLNGTNEWISVADHSDFDYEGDFTFEAWVKHSGVFGTFHDALIGKGPGNVPFWWIAPDGDMVLRDGSLSTNVSRTVDPVITDTNWHHLVVTYEKGVECRMFVDGVEVAVDGFNDATFVNGSGSVGLGSGWGSVWSDGWHGSLDEIAIYNYVLTPTQVTQHYLVGAGVDVILPRINQAAVAFSPSVVGGTLFVTLPLINQAAATFAPTVAGPQDVALGLINQAAATFAPTITGGTVFTDASASLAVSLDMTATASSDVVGGASLGIDVNLTATAERDLPLPTPPGGGGSGGTGGNSGGPYPPSITVIKVNGVDVSDDVRYRDATFTSQVNGTPGECSFAIRDLGHEHGFKFGQTITVDVNGKRQWRGFVRQVKRQYTAPVVDTTDPDTTARWFLIIGWDINVLLQKRIVWNKSNPTKGLLTPPSSLRDPKHAGQWVEDSPVEDVVRYCLQNYTDLPADGVSLSGIDMAGTPNPDFAAAYSGAMPIDAFMHDLNRLLSGIYYITPHMRFCYHSVEKTTTPYIISDAPHLAGSYGVGPREYELVSDGAQMVNDAMLWGTAPGVDVPGGGVAVFSRTTDSDSIDRHGRWQLGDTNFGIYKQTSADQRTESMVYGNDASRIAPKDDRISVLATVFEPLFELGDVVRCEQRVFDGTPDTPFETDEDYVAINLPVRRMTLTFPTKTATRWQVLLTQELDEPWSIYEYIFPKIPGFRFPPWPPFGPWPPLPWPDIPEGWGPGDGGCTDEVCGITDTFSRTVLGGWGTSDAGVAWTTAVLGSGTTSINVLGNVYGSLLNSGSSAGTSVVATLGGTVPNEYVTRWDPTKVKTIRFQWANVDPIYSDDHFYINWGVFRAVGQPLPSIVWRGDLGGASGGTSGSWHIRTTGGLLDGTLIPNSFWNDFTIYTWTCYDDGGTFYTSITDGVDTYTASQGYSGDQDMRLGLTFHSALQFPFDETGRSIAIHDIDIPEINACSEYRFDNFNRTVSGNWGVSDQGDPWTNTGPGGYTAKAVADGYGKIEQGPGFTGGLTGVKVNGSQSGSGRWKDTIFSCLTRLKIQASSAGSNGTAGFFFDQTASPFGRTGFGINKGTDVIELFFGDAFSSSTSISAATTLTVGSHYLIRYERTEDSHRVKIWADGTAEPTSWTLEDDGITWGGADDFTIYHQRSSSSSLDWKVWYDYIDFDYEGKPCHCSEIGETVVLDDFNRSSGGPGWGVASSGFEWFEHFDWSGLSVDGTRAVAHWGSSDSDTFGTWLGSPLSAGGTGPWATYPSWEMTARWRFDVVASIPSIGGGSPDAALQFVIANTPGSIRLRVDVTDTSSYDPIIYIDNASGGNSAVANWVALANTDYLIKWQYASGVHRAKIWQASAAEPPWMVTAVAPATLNPTSFTVNQTYKDSITLTTPWRERNQWIDYISFTEVGCVEGGGGDGLPNSGFVCETLEHSGGNGPFFASRSFGYGTLEVYINGELLFPDQYTSTSASFTLEATIASNAQLRICYNALGPTALGDV